MLLVQILTPKDCKLKAPSLSSVVLIEKTTKFFFILSVIVTCHFFSSFPLFFRPLCRNPTKQEFLQLTPTFPLSERQIKKFRSCLL